MQNSETGNCEFLKNFEVLTKLSEHDSQCQYNYEFIVYINVNRQILIHELA